MNVAGDERVAGYFWLLRQKSRSSSSSSRRISASSLSVCRIVGARGAGQKPQPQPSESYSSSPKVSSSSSSSNASIWAGVDSARGRVRTAEPSAPHSSAPTPPRSGSSDSAGSGKAGGEQKPNPSVSYSSSPTPSRGGSSGCADRLERGNAEAAAFKPSKSSASMSALSKARLMLSAGSADSFCRMISTRTSHSAMHFNSAGSGASSRGRFIARRAVGWAAGRATTSCVGSAAASSFSGASTAAPFSSASWGALLLCSRRCCLNSSWMSASRSFTKVAQGPLLRRSKSGIFASNSAKRPSFTSASFTNFTRKSRRRRENTPGSLN
mmetsp:Transcript_13077/g.32641  ORF Transcript_13077/g.32641 Transcript_13077/m.32641 type:complete len:325 (+) Transcript_13077:439-1413(+)